MLEEERSWELTIASAGLDGPSGEVVAVGLGQQVGVEFRRKELSVHGLVLVFVFAVILFFDPVWFELQSERLELEHSSEDVVSGESVSESGPKKKSRPKA